MTAGDSKGPQRTAKNFKLACHFGKRYNSTRRASMVAGVKTPLCTQNSTSSRQCAKAAAVANAVLGMIRRTFLCKDKELILQL